MIKSQGYRKRLVVIQYLVEAQVVLDGVRGVEDGPTGSENHDKTVESLWVKQRMHTDRQLAETSHCVRKQRIENHVIIGKRSST